MASVNRCIELLKQGKPVFVQHDSVPPPLTFVSGRSLAGASVDLLIIEFEHAPFDVAGLSQFMQGMKSAQSDGNADSPPSIVVSMPGGARSVADVRANAWQIRQALATGVHGVMQPHACSAEAVGQFVAAARYVVHDGLPNGAGLPSGSRGGGGESVAADLWGVSVTEYIDRADPWPLNPNGELLLGLKIEDPRILQSVDEIAAVPGIAFAEWGPLDMGLSLGHRGVLDPPYPADMQAACDAVRDGLAKSGAAFYCHWDDPSLTPEQRVDYLLDEVGARFVGVSSSAMAQYGRRGRRRHPRSGTP